MAHSHSCEAIVLRAIDVGEADRFCMLLTREEGRLSARARGVRKLHSKMGGSLLPLSRIQADITETRSGHTITGARLIESISLTSLASFTVLQEGIELLLRLTEEGEPMSKIFDATREFLSLSQTDSSALSVFTLRLLSLLGLLSLHDPRAVRLSEAEHAFLSLCAEQTDLATLCAHYPKSEQMSLFIRALLADHLERPLKAGMMRF